MDWDAFSSLSSLGSRLTGIVTTTDNGGSTGRIRRSEGGIVWAYAQLPFQPADNGTEASPPRCLNTVLVGNGELSGHNLGKL